MDVPPPKKLPETDVKLPYVVLGDEAFPLLENLMKPYPRIQSLNDRTKAIFNYRLSRARRIVENSFGILTNRFRVFSTPIHLNTATIEDVITSACIIHNLIIDEKEFEHFPDNDDPIILESIENYREVDNDLNEGQAVRDQFKDYFNSTLGSVPWQNETIRL